MSDDGWEQRLDDLGQARELREAIRQFLDDEVLMRTGRSIGDLASGHVADALLAGPLAPLLAAQAAVERVEALLPSLHREKAISSFPLRFGYEDSANRLRKALDGTT